MVLVREDMHPAIIDLLAKTITEVHGTASIFQRAGEFPSVADPEYPVAEEAREYYRNGPSFLNRYLPFWVTNIVKRVLALALTAVAIILPVLSYGPNFYKWLIEYRLRALYRRLRSVEERLHRGTGRWRKRSSSLNTTSSTRLAGQTFPPVFFGQIPPQSRAHPHPLAPCVEFTFDSRNEGVKI